MTFEEFAAARLPALLRYATLLVGDPELGRDLVQEVLARALVRWRRVSTADEPYAYVRKMVTNEYLSLLRRRSVPTVSLTHQAMDGPLAPAELDMATQVVDRADLWQRILALPRQHRAVIVLRYYEDLSDDEIAETLGCRPGTVRGYISRALAALRVELTEWMTSNGRSGHDRSR